MGRARWRPESPSRRMPVAAVGSPPAAGRPLSFAVDSLSSVIVLHDLRDKLPGSPPSLPFNLSLSLSLSLFFCHSPPTFLFTRFLSFSLSLALAVFFPVDPPLSSGQFLHSSSPAAGRFLIGAFTLRLPGDVCVCVMWSLG